MNLKGLLPVLVLQVLATGPNYGYQILIDIQEQSQNILDYNEGALYPVLYQLEKEGLIENYTEQVNGRVRRFYQLTTLGRERLAAERDDWQRLVQGVNLVLKGATA